MDFMWDIHIVWWYSFWWRPITISSHTIYSIHLFIESTFLSLGSLFAYILPWLLVYQGINQIQNAEIKRDLLNCVDIEPIQIIHFATKHWFITRLSHEKLDEFPSGFPFANCITFDVDGFFFLQMYFNWLFANFS